MPTQPTIARIWRAGCIIRSQFLGTIAEAFEESASAPNLLMAPAFIEMMREAHPALRRVVGRDKRRTPTSVWSGDT